MMDLDELEREAKQYSGLGAPDALRVLALARAGSRLADFLDWRHDMMRDDTATARDWVGFEKEVDDALAAFREAQRGG